MDLRRVLGAELYERAKAYSDRKFGSRKLALLVRMAVEQFLDQQAVKPKEEKE